MSFFGKLFGGGSDKRTPEAEPQIYKDYRIFPDPIEEEGRHRIAARIEKEIGGETRIHKLIRADTINDRDTAVTASVEKAKQVIDEQGDRIFG